MNRDIHELTNLVSLGLTIPTVTLAIAVVYMWSPAAKDKLFKSNKEAKDWFILGVCLGFLGASIHGLYWFTYWLLDYFEINYYSTLKDYGPTINILSRQGLGMLAAYCHLRAALITKKRNTRVINHLLVTSHLSGCILILLLFIVNNISM